MKLNYWILSAVVAAGAMVASGQNQNAAPTQPPPIPGQAAPMQVDPAPTPSSASTNAPAKHKKRTHPVKKTASEKPAVAKKESKDVAMKYDPPLEGVAKDAVVNIRGQPNFVGEVVGHLKKGETVTVYETIQVNTHGKDEPSKWDRVDLPTNRLVWVDAAFVDTKTMTVKAKKLNVRGGPGENYSVVGRLAKGDAIAEVKKEHGWIGVNPPTNSFGYIAAECLNLQAAPPPVVAATPPPQPAPTLVQTPVEAPAPTPAQPEPAAPAPTAASQTEQEIAALHKAETPPAQPAGTPPSTILPAEVPPRIVTREGFVHRAYNIQAPADFELHDIKTGEVIDFLQPQTNQNLKMYIGTRITVTGAEVMDSRWPRTPILQVQSVDLMP